jgi:DinB superfamily
MSPPADGDAADTGAPAREAAMTTDATAALAAAVADTDAALARLEDIAGRLGDGDLHLAHRDGGWTVAQVISHINVCAILWLGDLGRLCNDARLSFFFREEIGHDALGYPPPTVEVAVRQLRSTRRTVATCVPAIPANVLSRTIEIPDLGTMTIAEWTPLILGHLISHTDQATAILRDRDALAPGF